MSKTETREEWFCRIASDVVREHGLASLEKSMSQDLFRFIHFFQEKARQEQRPASPATLSPAPSIQTPLHTLTETVPA